MDFKLFIAVFCLAGVHYSEQVTTLDNSKIISTAVTACSASGTTVTYTKPTASGGTAPYSYSTTLTQLPASPVLFAVSAAGEVTTSGTLTANTAYVLTITVQDSASPATTAAFDLSVPVYACSGAEALLPSLAVICIAVLSLLFKRN